MYSYYGDINVVFGFFGTLPRFKKVTFYVAYVKIIKFSASLFAMLLFMFFAHAMKNISFS
jgi:hypothetical protein